MSVNIHPVSEEQVMEYLDGELLFEEAQNVAEHLATCRECQALAAELQRVSRALQLWQVAPGDVKLPRSEEASPLR